MNEKNVHENAEKPVISAKDKLKNMIKEYGSTVLIFHISLSLTSLAFFYQLVSSGLDVVSILNYIGLGSTTVSNNLASGASTFVVAYAVHKVFAPFRLSLTFVAIVRFLRSHGILAAKPSKKA